MVRSYVDCALWATSHCDENGNDLGTLDQFEPSRKLIAQARKDCREFLALAGSEIYAHNPIQVGHDFWLTRERHGAGFWDRNLGNYYEKTLTDIAHGFGDCYLYVSRGRVMPA